MKKLLLVLAISLFIMPAFAQEVEQMRVALLDLQSKNAPKELALAISDLLRIELIKEGAFEVLDRDNMKAILKEQAFQGSGCTDAACAVEMGQMLNCQKMFVGALSKIGTRYFLSIQRVDVETARVDYADSVEATDENSLPEAAVEMAQGMSGEDVKKSKKKRKKASRQRPERESGLLDPVDRRVVLSVGVLAGDTGGTELRVSGVEDQIGESNGNGMGPTIGLRYNFQKIDWLGFGIQVGFPGGGEELFTKDYAGQYWDGVSYYDWQRNHRVEFEKVQYYLFKLYVDVGSILQYAPGRLQLFTGFGQFGYDYLIDFRLSYQGGEEYTATKQGRADNTGPIVGLAVAVWRLELSATAMFYGEGVACENVVPEYNSGDPVVEGMAVDGYTLQFRDSSMLLLGVSFIL